MTYVGPIAFSDPLGEGSARGPARAGPGWDGCAFPSLGFANLDLPGLDLGVPLAFAPDMAAALARELGEPGYLPRPVVLGGGTDPYQPVDRTLRLTRAVLEVAERFGHPVSVVTGSAGVLQDLGILRSLAARGLARVWFPLATLDLALARQLEPRAAAPARRLHAAALLSAAGVPVGVLAAPLIPGLNDAEMERILDAAARAGARHAGYAPLRLPDEAREAAFAWLHERFPDRARRVLDMVRETRAGSPRGGPPGPATGADALALRFSHAARHLGLQTRNTLDTAQFAPPGQEAGAEAEAQLSLP